ncbi:MAG: hypothetical protein WAT67_08325 [Candidatus Contendobacter sp.]
MIGLDTNILARFYVDDPNDPEAAKQRPVARRILVESPQLLFCQTGGQAEHQPVRQSAC